MAALENVIGAPPARGATGAPASRPFLHAALGTAFAILRICIACPPLPLADA
jgi:hypothetical protein